MRWNVPSFTNNSLRILSQVFILIQFNYSIAELSSPVTRADNCFWIKLDSSITCILHEHCLINDMANMHHVWKTPSNMCRRESKHLTLLYYKKSIKYRSMLQQLAKYSSLKRCMGDCRTSRYHWLALWAGLDKFIRLVLTSLCLVE